MARLELEERAGVICAVVTLSRRNLLTLLHKLDMPESKRTFVNNDCWVAGEQAPAGELLLVLRCEDDPEHYAKREAGPGPMHPDTEVFVTGRGGVAGDGAIVPGFGVVRPGQRTND